LQPSRNALIASASGAPLSTIRTRRAGSFFAASANGFRAMISFHCAAVRSMNATSKPKRRRASASSFFSSAASDRFDSSVNTTLPLCSSVRGLS